MKRRRWELLDGCVVSGWVGRDCKAQRTRKDDDCDVTEVLCSFA